MADRKELLVRYRGDTRSLQKATNDATKSVNRFTGRTEKASKSLKKSFSSLNTLLAAGAVAGFSRSVVNTSIQMEKLNALMLSAVGVGGDVNAEFERLVRLSDDLGLEFSNTAETFAQFSAAARASGLEMDIVRDVFDETAKAGRAMNLTAADMSGVFTALTQIAGKGVVSMEEMRQQLGERVPIAMSAMADGLDMSVAKLTELISSGKLAAGEGLQALAKGFRENDDLAASFAESTDSVSATINRAKNALFNFQLQLAESGAVNLFSTAIEGIGDALVYTGNQLKNFMIGLQQMQNLVTQGMLGVLQGLGNGADFVARRFGLSTTQIEKFNKAVKMSQQDVLNRMSTDMQGVVNDPTKMRLTTTTFGADTTLHNQQIKNIKEIKKAVKDVDDAMGDAAKTNNDFANSMADALSFTGDGFNDLRSTAINALNDIQRNMMRLAFGGDTTGGFTGAISDALFSGLTGALTGGFNQSNSINPITQGVPHKPRFASGGSFRVGGSGGTDSQNVSFMASPRERVTIETPQQQQRSGGQAVIVNQSINLSTGVQQTVRSEIFQLMPVIEKQTVNAVMDARKRGKS